MYSEVVGFDKGMAFFVRPCKADPAFDGSPFAVHLDHIGLVCCMAWAQAAVNAELAASITRQS